MRKYRKAATITIQKMGIRERGKELCLWRGCLYVPLHSPRVAGGIFLPNGYDSVENHLRIPKEEIYHRGIWDRFRDSERVPRPGLHAAKVQGDSMIDAGIFDGDFIFYQRAEFDYVHDSSIVVIDRLSDTEGMGAWSLKRLIFEPPRRKMDEFGEDIGTDSPRVTLRSHNRRIRPIDLDSNGEYAVRGILRRAIDPSQAFPVDSEMLFTLMKEDSSEDPS